MPDYFAEDDCWYSPFLVEVAEGFKQIDEGNAITLADLHRLIVKNRADLYPPMSPMNFPIKEAMASAKEYRDQFPFDLASATGNRHD